MPRYPEAQIQEKLRVRDVLGTHTPPFLQLLGIHGWSASANNHIVFDSIGIVFDSMAEYWYRI